MADDLQFRVDVQGGVQGARAFDTLRGSLSGIEAQADKASLKLAGLGTVLNLAGSTLATLSKTGNETVGMLGDLASKAGTVISAFATGGPWGAALAAGVLALDALVTIMDRANDSMAGLSNRMRELTAELDQLARRRQALETFAPGLAAREAAGRNRPQTIEDIEAAEKESRRKRAELARQQAETRRGGRRAGRAEDPLEAQLRSTSETSGLGRDILGQFGGADFGFDETRGTGPGTITESLQGLARAQATLDSLADSLDRIRRMQDPFARAAKGAKDAGKAIIENIGENATSALRSHVDAWVSGQETIGQAAAGIAKDVIKAVVVESIVKAVFETAEGFASAARYDFPGAAQHFAAAGTYAAVAGVAGGVGLAVGAVGGGQTAQAGGTAGAPARPDRDRRERDRGDQGTTMINVYALEPSAETGRRIVKAIDQAKRLNLVPA